MAVTYDAVSLGTLVTSTIPHDPPITEVIKSISHIITGSNTFLVSGISFYDGVGDVFSDISNYIYSVDYNGTAMTYLGTVSNVSRIVSLYYLINPDTGTHNVNVNFHSSDEASDVIITANISNNSFAGVNQSVPIVQSGTATGSTSPITVTLSGTVTGNMILDTCIETTATLTVGANQTQKTNFPAGTLGATQRQGSSVQDPADGGVMSWTESANKTWATYAMEVGATAGASAEPNLLTLLGVGQ
jgi:hypothetical protein